jgi:hypothetical protein
VRPKRQVKQIGGSDMTIKLELKPELEEQLRANAARVGLPVERYLLNWIEQAPQIPTPPTALPATLPGDGNYPPGSLTELFAQWQAEDATDDPELLRKADEELEELKANLNATRAANGEEPLFL